ncbi:unnamed protein product [Plutella xylostella]|uniref:(diamondback moth) hypothetical protein n=1 Tax=Plutella xylostella TaxID=51655 RepID=A0A8S4GCM6_PLUXY|nr:unnamed protein product [Plutella xylostella]
MENVCSVADKCKEVHKSRIKVEEFYDDTDDIFSNEICDEMKEKEISTQTKKSQNDEPTRELVRTKKQFLCDHCGKICPSPAHLRLHMSTHYNIFPFKCDECPYKGRTKTLLNLHKKTHLDVKPCKCMYCPRTMTTIGNLKKHIARVHSTARPFECSICEKRFKIKSDLNKHINFIHENRGFMECEICKKAFRKKHLRKHQFRIHKIQREKIYPSKVPSYILCSRTTGDQELASTEVIEQNPVV